MYSVEQLGVSGGRISVTKLYYSADVAKVWRSQLV